MGRGYGNSLSAARTKPEHCANNCRTFAKVIARRLKVKKSKLMLAALMVLLVGLPPIFAANPNQHPPQLDMPGQLCRPFCGDGASIKN